jgi:hypothetical protein
MLELLLEFWSTVLGFALRLILPDVTGQPRPARATDVSTTPTQPQRPGSQIADTPSSANQLQWSPAEATVVSEDQSDALPTPLPDVLSHSDARQGLAPPEGVEADDGVSPLSVPPGRDNGTSADVTVTVVPPLDISEPVAVTVVGSVEAPPSSESEEVAGTASVAAPTVLAADAQSPSIPDTTSASLFASEPGVLVAEPVESLGAGTEDAGDNGADPARPVTRHPFAPLPLLDATGVSIRPELRGGAPRGSRAVAADRLVAVTVERPELVCVRHGNAFRIGFDAGAGAPTVRCGADQPLAIDHGLQLVTDLGMHFTWRDAKELVEEVRLPGVLVFQLSADEARGWHVGRAGAGVNLIVASRDYELAPAQGVTVKGRPGIGIEGHQAWEVQIEESATALPVRSPSAGFDLPVGRLQVSCNEVPVGRSEHGVPVFGPLPPHVAFPDDLRPRLDCLVIGREGAMAHREQERVEPNADLASRINALLRAGGCGWYFVRVYGRDEQGAPVLESSTSFWYVPGLTGHASDAIEAMPQHGRHEEIELRVDHDGSLRCIQARSVAQGSALREFEIEPVAQGSRIAVPGTVVCDGVDVKMRSDNNTMLTLRIPVARYWWAVTDGRKLDGEWGSATIDLPPSAFRADSRQHLHVRLPALSPPDLLQVQFRDGPPHLLKLLRNSATTALRLGDLDGDMRFLKTAACGLFLIAPDGLGDEDHAVALRMVPAFGCRLCDAGYEDRKAADEHIRTAHLDDVRPPVTDYGRIAQAFNAIHPVEEHLPAKIHKCMLCTAYYPVDDWRAKQSMSVRHMATCPELPNSGHSSAPFYLINDIVKIRSSAARHLVERAGDAYGCKWHHELVMFGKQVADQHIFGEHRKQLYDAH